MVLLCSGVVGQASSLANTRISILPLSVSSRFTTCSSSARVFGSGSTSTTNNAFEPSLYLRICPSSRFDSFWPFSLTFSSTVAVSSVFL